MHKEVLPRTFDNPTVSATTCASYTDLNRLPRKSSMIVPVLLSHATNPDMERLVYAMLDTQSDTSFIAEETVRALGIRGKETQLILSTMTSNEKNVTCKRYNDLIVRGASGGQTIKLPTLFSRRAIPANQEHIPTDDMIEGWPHLEPIRNKLMPKARCEVGLLIGYDCPRALAPREIIHESRTSDGPFGMRTDLGWGIVGVISYPPGFSTDRIGFSHRILARPATGSQIVLPVRTKEATSPRDCLKLLEAAFLDKNDNEEGSSLNERKFLQTMEDGVVVDGSGHYSLPLPFNDKKKVLFDNKKLVVNRTMMLKKKFERDSTYKHEYNQFMEEMFQKGFAEEAADSEMTESGGVWYIPHFGIYHKVKRKLRVVFDCSAEYKGVSLNNTLLKGPDYTNLLIGILCRFRRYPIAFCCDIEKMFYAFHVHPSDRDYLRFLWWKDGDTSKPLSTYRMTTHIFGAVSSPSCATFGLRFIAKEFSDKYGDEVSEFIHEDFYVDDGLKSVRSVQEAKTLIKRTVALCQERGVRLHKFTSNSEDVLRSLPTSECATEDNLLSLDLEEHPTERVLGVLWNVKLDTFQFKIKLEESPTTRRGILSATSSIFDPLGWLAPFTVRARVILQQLCKEGLDWDEKVSHSALKEWTDWCMETPALHNLNIKRCFRHMNYSENASIQLHHFADASTYAFGACSYLRLVDDAGQVSVNLIMAKAKVTPLASLTIPRLELTAAVEASRLAALLEKELRYENAEHFFWTDSKIVLGYVANESRCFKVYVANRVQEIHNVSRPSQWRHVAGKDNPADLASRGMTAERLTNSSLWYNGPSFLQQKELELKDERPVIIPSDDLEIRKVKVCSTIRAEGSLEVVRFDSFSSWWVLKRAVARAKLFVRWLKSKSMNNISTTSVSNVSAIDPIDVLSLQDSELLIIRAVQRTYFLEEIDILQAQGRISKGSCLFKLDCFVDDLGVLRVGGRLRFAHLYANYKHPILLPKLSHISTLIMRDCHQSVKHQGRGMTVNEVRSRGYWIIGLSSQVKKLLHSCVICRYLRGGTQNQKMADLPPDRTECAPPFTYCGVDLFGPFLVKEKRSEVKRYGTIFTCLASRSVHIEMAYSLSTDAFIQTLRKFLAIRGPIRLLRCDNGTNFVGASRELSKSVNSILSSDLKAFLLEHNCDFEFCMNPPSASHMGGVWERMIRVVRSILNTLMDQHGTRLDDSSLSTFLYEVAAIINSRPLALDHVTDPNHPEPLTPNHLLTGKSKIVLPPPGQFCREDAYSIKRWRCVQYLADQFWQRWRKEYLGYLQSRSKWQKLQRDMRVGDVVLIKDENAPRNDWRRGIVTDTYASSDGHIRSVKLKTGTSRNVGGSDAGGTLIRPIQKLVLLLPSEQQM